MDVRDLFIDYDSEENIAESDSFNPYSWMIENNAKYLEITKKMKKARSMIVADLQMQGIKRFEYDGHVFRLRSVFNTGKFTIWLD